MTAAEARFLSWVENELERLDMEEQTTEALGRELDFHHLAGHDTLRGMLHRQIEKLLGGEDAELD